MHKFEEQGGDAKAVGWISMSDLFMLCSIMMLAVAVCFALSLKKTSGQLTSVKSDYAKDRAAYALTLGDLNTRLVGLNSEVGSYKSQTATLDLQLQNLTNSLSESDKNLAHFRNETAKYKSQSESLSNELTLQTNRLNAVQGEYDKYKNASSLKLTELNSDLARLKREADEYKLNITNLRTQADALELKLGESQKQFAAMTNEREKYRLQSEQAAVTLEALKLSSKGELAKASGELTRLSAELIKSKEELTKANAEREQLLAALNTSKTAQANLQKGMKDLEFGLNTVTDEKIALQTALADREGSLAALNSDLAKLKPMVGKLKTDLDIAHNRIVDLERAVFEKINRAKLVITLSAADVPKGFTLELFVTDPLDNVCGPFSSVIFNEGDEIGFLQQSVDFKSGAEGSQKAVFYSLRPLSSRNGRAYMVKAMIRHNGNDENVRLPHNVTVTCNIDLPQVSGPEAHKEVKLDITWHGYIKKVKHNGPLTASTQYKNMWPWEPSYHFERFVCDFSVEGNSIANLRTADKLPTETVGAAQVPYSGSREVEQRIDSVRNRN